MLSRTPVDGGEPRDKGPEIQVAQVSIEPGGGLQPLAEVQELQAADEEVGQLVRD